jgi:hypothetical protein
MHTFKKEKDLCRYIKYLFGIPYIDMSEFIKEFYQIIPLEPGAEVKYLLNLDLGRTVND